ncbi:DUF3307 domain-containing protein [Pseudotabrizicola alkalilacus]|uniref:DUF3307 domain-containing protein n=1 Tax=Pseudotabrizicola alkalilacus TaxID=2305252 RepID=A0A411Z4C2_9RHOB|nr:DUF3307 domain-containing protein [Pseudotabrizicola alkalilacus]RGP37872.1 DUF3307 domain-containing protein [Pseudotabrizicola alkalilacus]
MAETLALLLLAHVLADFVLQPDRMAQAKAGGHPGWMLAHIGIVGGITALVLGVQTPQAAAVVAGLTGVHLLVDAAKVAIGARLSAITAFLADQAAHLLTLLMVAMLVPELWTQGFWAPHTPLWLPAALTVIAGAVLATRAGGFALGLLMRPWGEVGLDGLPGGGRIIGMLERGIIFLLILGGEPGGIGFLIAAKSVLRFGAVKEESRLSEYVIIGTLASFGWAMLVAIGTVMLLSALPPLGIPDLSP